MRKRTGTWSTILKSPLVGKALVHELEASLALALASGETQFPQRQDATSKLPSVTRGWQSRALTCLT